MAKKQKKKRSKSVTQTHNEDAEASGLDDRADSGSYFWLAGNLGPYVNHMDRFTK